MNTLRLHLHFNHPKLNKPFKAKPKLIYPSSALSKSPSHDADNPRTSSHTERPLVLKITSQNPKTHSTGKLLPVVISSTDDHSRMVVVGAVSLGIALFLMGFDDHKALAFGPEGPLVEEFWDNMRRYALYALTVSTGAISALLEPIVELLKNPISAVLILVILGGGFFIVSQVVTAMVGLSDFSYEYSY